MKTKLVPFNIEKAKNGAKVITRCGYPVTIIGCNSNKKYPIRAIIKTEDGPFTFSFTVEGKYCVDEEEHELDFFIEEEDVEAEEEEEVEETDYDPYKATVESIADMVERYSELQSIEELKDFYNNVKIKCRDAFEYDNTWCKKQDEKKPTDNKPKFHEGDWIIASGIVHQIIRVVENVGSHTYGYDTADGFYIHDCSSSVRLWTIQDAKDGDVLCYETKSELRIFIYNNGCYSNGCIHYHCHYCNEHLTTVNSYFVIQKHLLCYIHPATKEQYNLLFQKIKEEGYEWDKEKTELKKIEKKTRRMTNQELSDWLRKCPEECREFKYKEKPYWVYSLHDYLESEADEPVNKNKLIRRNHGEWEEPLIEE